MSDSGPEQQSLLGALKAEYAAVFAYGIVAAFSNSTRSDLVSTNSSAHRSKRDAVIDALIAAGAAVPESAPGYAVPFAVTDPVTAAQLAAQIEVDTAMAWRSVIERSESVDTREMGIVALTEAAGRAAVWRSILGTDPAAVAFPGQA